MTWENRLTFEVSSADPDSGTPVWVDFTTRIRDAIQPLDLSIGRQDDLTQSLPSVWTLVLDNVDDALTYGNTASPYAAWWGPGRKCRLRETVAGVVMDRATGYLQTPTETLVTSGIEQRVTLSMVDRLGRLDSSEPFISTLTSYIRYVGGSALLGYWPCLERSGTTFANMGTLSTLPALAPLAPGFGSGTSVKPTGGTAAVTAGGATVVMTDDVTPMIITAATGDGGFGTTIAVAPDVRVQGFNRTISAGQVVTLVAWYYSTLPTDKSAATVVSLGATNSNISVNTTTAGLLFLAATGTLTSSFNSTDNMPDQKWIPLAVRYGWDSAVIELWVGRDRFTGVLAGVPVGPETLFSLNPATLYSGGLAHVQLYVGASTDFTNAMFIDQFVTAQTGFERQATGDRVRMIARFAGVPDTELTQVDTGASVMQRATLAGQTPLAAMRDAERTEQGLLYVDGSGNLVFKDRRTLYNI